jgi:hypothetical protein
MNPKKDENLIISYYALRKAIGWLGMLLPFILLIGNFLINHFNILNNSFFVNTLYSGLYIPDNSFKTSISHYYYSTMGEMFTCVLGAVALFLFCYKGHKLRPGEKFLSDSALTNLAGLFALGVIIFPTGSDKLINDNVKVFISSNIIGNIHLVMAALFFVSLSLMSMINFRRTGDRVSFGKLKNHNTYLACGIAMLICIALIFIYNTWLDGICKWFDNIHPVFFLESIALIFFGISWLTKGRVDFNYIPKILRLKW